MGGVAAAAVIGYFTADLPAAHDLATVPVSLTTRIYDRSGEHLLYTLEDERRELIGLDSVPKMMQDATIAIEDKSFWTNPGIDIGGIIRALNANAASGTISQGGAGASIDATSATDGGAGSSIAPTTPRTTSDVADTTGSATTISRGD